MFASRKVRRPDGGTECHCALCDVTLTWFTYANVWGGGKIVGRICHDCRSQLPSEVTGVTD